MDFFYHYKMSEQDPRKDISYYVYFENYQTGTRV